MNLLNHDFDDIPHACYIPFYVIIGERGEGRGDYNTNEFYDQQFDLVQCVCSVVCLVF